MVSRLQVEVVAQPFVAAPAQWRACAQPARCRPRTHPGTVRMRRQSRQEGQRAVEPGHSGAGLGAQGRGCRLAWSGEAIDTNGVVWRPGGLRLAASARPCSAGVWRGLLRMISGCSSRQHSTPPRGPEGFCASSRGPLTSVGEHHPKWLKAPAWRSHDPADGRPCLNDRGQCLPARCSGGRGSQPVAQHLHVGRWRRLGNPRPMVPVRDSECSC